MVNGSKVQDTNLELDIWIPIIIEEDPRSWKLEMRLSFFRRKHVAETYDEHQVVVKTES